MSEELKAEEEIVVEEEVLEDAGKEWTEEFKVAGEELVGAVKRLANEANVRRISVTNEDKGIDLQIPIVLGIAGILLVPVYASLALVAALVTDCTIRVVRVEKVVEDEPVVEVEEEPAIA